MDEHLVKKFRVRWWDVAIGSWRYHAGMRFSLALLIVALLLFITGCSGPTKTYSVAVKNELDQPITVWLTKSGPPVEASWLSPEQLATYENPRGEKIAGRAVPPGKVAETGNQKGHFPSGTEAVLRVYLGQHTLDELLATNTRSLNRVDVTLSPGRSDLVVQQKDGKLTVDSAGRKL
jgi:hypothetical protein